MTHAWFRRRRLPGRLGPVGVTRLLVFQLIQVGLFLVVVRGVWGAVLGAVVGALAIAVALGRRRGRWLTETAALWLRYRRHGGEAAVTERADRRLTALSGLVTDLVVEDVDGAEPGIRWGMGSDGAGWFAVLEVDAADAGVHPPVPLAALARVAADAGQPGVVMQVVSHAAGPRRTLWVAVRLDAQAVAASVADDPDRQPDVPAVLSEITRRVGRALRRRGLTARVLDADGLLDALMRSCDLALGAPAAPREDWRAWHSGRLLHRCFWLHTWPDPERGTTLLASLNELPGAQVSIAFMLEPRQEADGTDLRCLIRVAAEPARHQRVSDHAGRLAEQLGGRLFPLDGEQALAVYSTAPTGGGAR